jgi:Fe-S-cluster containining protein
MTMQCREGCAACCIAPSITSPLPGMPQGKPAGVACLQLDEGYRCKVFGQPQRPAFCAGLRPSVEMCGASRAQAMLWLSRLEQATLPV